MTDYGIMNACLEKLARTHRTRYLSTFFITVLRRNNSLEHVRRWFASSSGRQCNDKPKLSGEPVIIIPCHVNNNHWVALVHREISGRVCFYYADDMNISQIEKELKTLLHMTVDPQFYPQDPEWVHCKSYTYQPHSNECGPRTLLALAIMGLHPSPNENMLLPYMHINLDQISRAWVAYVLYNSEDSTILPRLGGEPQVEDGLIRRQQSDPSTLLQPSFGNANRLVQQCAFKASKVRRRIDNTQQRNTIFRRESSGMSAQKDKNLHQHGDVTKNTVSSSVAQKKTNLRMLYSNWQTSPNQSTIPQIRKTLTVQPTLYDYVFFKPHCSQNEQDPDMWGHVMESIDDTEMLRLVVQNPNGIKPQVLHSDLAFGLHVCERIGVGIISLPEMNVNWHQSWQVSSAKGCFKKL